jgi:hypothetical protein
MKKILVSSLALLFMTAMAMPASAFVVVFGEIEKDKLILVDEDVVKTKILDLTVTVNVSGGKAAEADAIVNQDNLNNSACENCAEKRDQISNSLNLNTGITNANQSAGNMNNQGNVVAVAVDSFQPPGTPPPVPPTQTGGFANAQASTSQLQGIIVFPRFRDEDLEPDNTNLDRTDGFILSPNVVRSVNILFRESAIRLSVNDNIGITNLNQAAGQMNNQANVTAIAACLDGSVALSEADLGQATIQNYVFESFTTKTATINASVNRNTGVTFVNQSSGNMANQANNLSLAVAIHP